MPLSTELYMHVQINLDAEYVAKVWVIKTLEHCCVAELHTNIVQ